MSYTNPGHRVNRRSAKSTVTARSFGALQAPKNHRGLDSAASWGEHPICSTGAMFACDEATRTIVKFNWLVPIVRAFGPEGEVRWQTTLDDYVPWQLWPNRRGQCCRYRPNPDEGFSHSGRAVVTDRNGHVLLGLQIEGPRSAENRRHELLVLDISSGRVIDRYRTSGAVGAVGNGLIFTYAEDPFPQLRVFATR